MDEAEADLFLKSIRPRQRVCVASSFVLNETAACSDMAMPMPITAGVPIQAEIRDTYLEVFSDGSSSFEQLTLVKDLTSNPNRLAIAKVFKASQSLKLGPYRIGQLEDRTKDALSSVGLRWSIVDVPEGENVPEALAPRIS
ncbi:MAG: hypothetical protein JO142_16420 [Burkholderiales bacterium]|nr:hypothetical protein [Burkholderiales bacterium]